uniref:Uncharacterized protein n=1 Tax=Cyprinodon variegatus TaxID=28743 RepID=A0A3Q2GIP8_CYPVA
INQQLIINRQRQFGEKTKHLGILLSLPLCFFSFEQKKTFRKPNHVTQREEPWRCLYITATQAIVFSFFNLKIPKDQLSLVYDHHKNFFWSKNQMLWEFYGIPENEIRVWVDPKRGSIHNLLISPHLAASDSLTLPSSTGPCTALSAESFSSPGGCIFATMKSRVKV